MTEDERRERECDEELGDIEVIGHLFETIIVYILPVIALLFGGYGLYNIAKMELIADELQYDTKAFGKFRMFGVEILPIYSISKTFSLLLHKHDIENDEFKSRHLKAKKSCCLSILILLFIFLVFISIMVYAELNGLNG